MLAALIVGLIAFLHVYILVLEMFLWTAPAGLRAFRNKAEFAEATKVLAANQGLYNGFLAAGLFWALWKGVLGAGFEIALFFLTCVLVAGLYGAATAARRILYIQSVPAALGIAAVLTGI